ncbi:MAG TPA: hypothetical protein VGH64_12340 [Puia sp.]|jgi:hypothetical protein
MKKYGISFAICVLLNAVCTAQIPVSQESRHHKILENDHVRLLDVHIPPGDTTLFHIHATPSVFLILHNVRTGSQVISEEDHSKSPIPHFGNMWFEGFYVKPRIHRVWNNDSSEFHVMDIELTNKNYVTIGEPVKQAPFKFLFDEKPVRAYRLDMNPATDISIGISRADILMILLTDSVSSVHVNKKDFQKKGDFLYVSSGTSIEAENKGKTEAAFAFFELK